uniref:Protein kinase domain-containing protein n=1 Tax=Chenopodium quinoa TaxID=63459 RepID=A0A803LJS4_CHEQI
MSLAPNLNSKCFDPKQFVITPDVCAGIVTIRNWTDKLGSDNSLDQVCGSDLSDLTACETCYAAGTRIQNQLIAIDGNSSHARDCFYFTILYVAGIINKLDPENAGTTSCVFQLQLLSSAGSHEFNKPKWATQKILNMALRKCIILDVARGLAYLHHGIEPAIYHRDIKATNNLLDSDMRARVADFGLEKEIKEGHSHLTTRVAGTHDYLTPEYALYGQLTEKSDV